MTLIQQIITDFYLSLSVNISLQAIFAIPYFSLVKFKLLWFHAKDAKTNREEREDYFDYLLTFSN